VSRGTDRLDTRAQATVVALLTAANIDRNEAASSAVTKGALMDLA